MTKNGQFIGHTLKALQSRAQGSPACPQNALPRGSRGSGSVTRLESDAGAGGCTPPPRTHFRTESPPAIRLLPRHTTRAGASTQIISAEGVLDRPLGYADPGFRVDELASGRPAKILASRQQVQEAEPLGVLLAPLLEISDDSPNEKVHRGHAPFSGCVASGEHLRTSRYHSLD